MTIQTIPAASPRPTPHEVIDSWPALDAWLHRWLRNLDADCYDDETIGHIGRDAHNRSLGRVGVIRDVLVAIAPLVEAEGEDQAEAAAGDTAEAGWKELRTEGLDENELRAAAGDR